jgi:hypothetical protein
MTLTIDLKPETEARLKQEAVRRGQEPADVVRHLIEVHIPLAPDAENQALIDLLREWREEDTALTPEELAEEQTEWEHFKSNVNAYRAEAGERPIYK